jgi:DNA-binding PadR family transcriptional regulator
MNVIDRYLLRKALEDRGLDADEGTLYPLRSRLEHRGLLVSGWREADSRKERCYRLSNDGRLMLDELLEEWERLNASLDLILGRSRFVA